MENVEILKAEPNSDLLDLNKQLEVFNPISATINHLRDELKAITPVESGTDKKQAEVFKDFKNKKLVKIKTTLEQARKAKKSFYLQAGREIDSKAKEVSQKLERMIDFCENQVLVVAKHEAEIEAEKKRVKQARIDAMVEKLEEIEVMASFDFLETCTDKEFEDYLIHETKKFNEAKAFREEQIKKEEEERERLVKERAELEEMKAKMKVQQDALDAEKRKVEQEKFNALQKEKLELEAKQKLELEAKAEQVKQEAEVKKLSEDEVLFDKLMLKFDTHAKAINEIIRLGRIIKKERDDKK